MGTAAIIHQLFRAPDGTLRIIVQGFVRIRLLSFLQTQPYLVARLEPAQEPEARGVEFEALKRTAGGLFRQLVPLVPEIPNELADAEDTIQHGRQLAYLITATMPLDVATRQEVLELNTIPDKLRRLTELLQQLEKAGLPDEARREAERELSRLERLPAVSPEHGIIRNYLDWLLNLPWNRITGSAIDVSYAHQVLDQDHYDLERIKDRILEYLAVKKLRDERHAQVSLAGAGEAEHAAQAGPLPQTPADEGRREPILCFVGPPGVGKTSLGQSIARAMGRKFVRISLGGVHDESEIRGHRRTYIGALPGRIIQALRRVEAADAVFMLDEVDKMGTGFHGDPAAALLEVLDPAQNNTFVDTYLGVPFDLSRVLFICTANAIDTIPPPLLDRIELLRLAGYTEAEKLHIARRYLVPKQVRAHGLRDDEITLDDPALQRIIREYTREAGVRNLEREIAAVIRKAARRISEGTTVPIHVGATEIPDYLRRPRFYNEVVERIDRPGVATGLAWTPVGGDVLFVEATMMPGRDERLILTGMLGDVMRESAQAALSYLRSNAADLGIDLTMFTGQIVHVHVPAGATPKDGPSAGVTMLTAIASLAMNRRVRNDIAMTGEITLRGKVLPVGRIREKVLAAYQAGVKTIILPQRNEPDLEDVSEDVRRNLQFVFADSAKQVLDAALST